MSNRQILGMECCVVMTGDWFYCMIDYNDEVREKKKDTEEEGIRNMADTPMCYISLSKYIRIQNESSD